jgi:hypothetical protein
MRKAEYWRDDWDRWNSFIHPGVDGGWYYNRSYRNIIGLIYCRVGTSNRFLWSGSKTWVSINVTNLLTSWSTISFSGSGLLHDFGLSNLLKSASDGACYNAGSKYGSEGSMVLFQYLLMAYWSRLYLREFCCIFYVQSCCLKICGRRIEVTYGLVLIF